MGKKLANVSITLEQPLPLKKMWRNTCNKILLFPLKVPSSVAVSIFTSLYNHHYLISELLQHLKRKPHTIKALPFPLWINLLFWFFLWPLGTQGTVLWAWPQPAACFVWRAGDVWETSSREKGRGSKKNKEEEERWMGVEEDSFSQRPGGGWTLSRVTNSKTKSCGLSSWSRRGSPSPIHIFPLTWKPRWLYGRKTQILPALRLLLQLLATNEMRLFYLTSPVFAWKCLLFPKEELETAYPGSKVTPNDAVGGHRSTQYN